MNCQRVQDHFLDHQDGTLAPDEAAQLRTHLSSCPDCQREWAALQEITRKLDALPAAAPSPRLREQFYAMLGTHQREADSVSPFAIARSRIDRFFETLLPHRPSLQFALSLALLAAGVFAGARFLMPPAPPPVTVTVADASARKELADLKARMSDMSRLVTYSLLQQQSTSDRLQSVLATMDVESPDHKVLAKLVGTLAFDPSINVRLSAVEALAPHTGDSLVRAGLLSALPRESAPLVQVAMIELLAAVGAQDAAPILDQLIRNDATDKNVRDAARRALAVLRSPLTPPADNQNALQSKTTNHRLA